MKKLKKNISQLRIISGQWRGMKIDFPLVQDLRPTPDNVRETVFNWLAPYIKDTRCLDLFAGSGALGFESLSRGAKEVIFVDKSVKAVNHIKKNISRFKTEHAEAYVQDANSCIRKNIGKFDIVFIDPPYQWSVNNSDNLSRLFSQMESEEVLADEAIIYVECPKHLQSIKFPETWDAHRTKVSGQVQYQLLMRNTQESPLS